MVSALAVQELLAAGSGSLVLQGPPGSGKTSLLESAVSPGLTVVRFAAYPDETTVPGSMVDRPDLLRYLTALDGPVLCLADDLQWADEESLNALTFAARRLQGRSVMMILATSARTAPAGIPVHRLEPLSRQESFALLDSLGTPADRQAELVEMAQGNPQALVDRSLLFDAYVRRLDLLPQSTRWLLLVAAAEEEMDTATLLHAASLSGVDVLALSPAEEAGLVHAGERLCFEWPMLRDVIYREAPLAHRRAAHLLLAQVPGISRLRRAVHRAAAAVGPDARLAAELEQAAGEAEGYDGASTALERAAQLTASPAGAAKRLVTAAQYAWLAGSPHRARSLLETASPVSGVDEGRRDVLAGEIELRSGAASSTLDRLLAAADRFGDSSLSLAALIRASEAVCFSGDHERFAEITARLKPPGDSPASALIFAYLTGLGATFTGRFREGTIALRRVLQLAGQLTDPASLTCASASALLLGDDHTAHRFAVKAIVAARSAGDLAALPIALEMQAVAEYWLGRYDIAATTSQEGLSLAHACGQDNYASDHQAMLAVLAAIRGERDTCLELLHTLSVPAGAGQISRPAALSRWARAVLDVVAGRPADAVTRLTSIADPLTGQGHVVVQMMATPWLVEAAVRSGDRDAALAAHAAFARWAGSTGDALRQALSARCRALLAPRASTEAEDHFREALHLHLSGEADFERARTELLFGQELRRSRRSREAREFLNRAVETFHHLGAAAWVEQAQAELRAAGALTESIAIPESLTAQQQHIARLVAEGATNREVAAQLFLSPRTVDHHLRNIFTRLGIRSRVELTKMLR